MGGSRRARYTTGVSAFLHICYAAAGERVRTLEGLGALSKRASGGREGLDVKEVVVLLIGGDRASRTARALGKRERKQTARALGKREQRPSAEGLNKD